MIDNAPESLPLSIIPTPVVVFTHADAQRAAGMCPIKQRTDWHNIISVGAYTDVRMLAQSAGALVVTHHIKSKAGRKEKAEGSWTVTVALANLGVGEPHCFKVVWPAEAKPVLKAPETPEVFKEVLGETGPAVVAHR